MIETRRLRYVVISIQTISKLHTTEVFISTSLIESSINHEKFVSVNNVLRWSYTQGANFMLGNPLFEAVKYTKNADLAKIFLFRIWNKILKIL